MTSASAPVPDDSSDRDPSSDRDDDADTGGSPPSDGPGAKSVEVNEAERRYGVDENPG